jgi:hypothetical protein
MQELDIRYVLILIPIIYVILPYLFVVNLNYFTVVSLTTIVISISVTWLLTSLNIVGTGMNQEGTYQAFVLVTGTLFYGLSFIIGFLGGNSNNNSGGATGLDQVFWNWILGTKSTTDVNGQLVNNVVRSTPQNVCYPLNIQILGISFFGTLDIIMGLILILGMYFMIASRGH